MPPLKTLPSIKKGRNVSKKMIRQKVNDARDFITKWKKDKSHTLNYQLKNSDDLSPARSSYDRRVLKKTRLYTAATIIMEETQSNINDSQEISNSLRSRNQSADIIYISKGKSNRRIGLGIEGNSRINKNSANYISRVKDSIDEHNSPDARRSVNEIEKFTNHKLDARIETTQSTVDKTISDNNEINKTMSDNNEINLECNKLIEEDIAII